MPPQASVCLRQGGLIAESTLASLTGGILVLPLDLGKHPGGDLIKSIATQSSRSEQRVWQSLKVLALSPPPRLVPYVAAGVSIQHSKS